MELLVDIGNSRMKWATQSDVISSMETVSLADAAFLDVIEQRWLTLEPPKKIVVSSVSHSEIENILSDWMLAHWAITPLLIDSKASQLGVTNNYKNPSQLGSDRWAALITAHQNYAGECCVIDCGTAMTIDGINRHGQHLGGIIFPGLDMVRKSLCEGTQRIQLESTGSINHLAKSTTEAVLAGSIYGLAGAIERIVYEFTATMETSPQLLMTGGNAAMLKPYLNVHCVEVPDLVIQGLALLARDLE